MIIKHDNGREVDTDKLNDVDAILLEKSKEFIELCHTYDRGTFVVVEACSPEGGSMTYFHNIGTKGKFEVTKENMNNWINMILVAYDSMLNRIFPNRD